MLVTQKPPSVNPDLNLQIQCRLDFCGFTYMVLHAEVWAHPILVEPSVHCVGRNVIAHGLALALSRG